MKRKFFIVMVFVSLLLGLAGCGCFENPADAERIGSGYIKYDRGRYFVEIDSVKYSPKMVYANSSSRDGKNTMEPVDGMLVTVFRVHGNSYVNFIAGDISREYLEDYFSTNYAVPTVCCGLFVLGIGLMAYGGKFQKKRSERKQ